MQLDAMKRVYDILRPEDSIFSPDMTDFDEAKMMAPMIVRLIQCLSWGNARGEFYVYEGVSFDMDAILPALPKEMFPVSLDDFIVICMGYAQISPEEKVQEIVRYETARDWSFGLSMEEKLAHCQTYCNESRVVQEAAERLGLRYFDVSFDRAKVLDEIMEHITQNVLYEV